MQRGLVSQDEIKRPATQSGEDRPVGSRVAHFAGSIGGLERDAAPAEIGDGFGPNRMPETLQATGGKARFAIADAADWHGYLRRGAGRKCRDRAQEIPPFHGPPSSTSV